jgi:hypothetical protein
MNPDPVHDTMHPLAAVSRRKDRALREREAARTAAVVLGLLLAFALVDGLGSLPSWARWAGWVAAVSALGLGVARVRRILRAPTPVEEAARDVESQRPGLGNEVVTAAEYLSGRRIPANDMEAALAAALVRRAARHVADANPGYRGRLARPAWAGACAAVALWVAFAWAFPSAWISIVRTVAPWSRASHTRIRPSQGAGEFPLGFALVITNRIEGRMPRTARWQQRDGPGSPWRSVDLPVTQGVARHAFTVQRSLEWRVLAGDGETDVFRLDAYTPPAATNFHVRLTPPAYTRLPAVERSTPDVAAVRGTKVAWTLEANVPLSAASLRLTNGAVVPLRRDDERRWSIDVAVLSNMAFTVVLADAQGRPGIDAAVRRIRALADAPPSIEITQPGHDIRARPTDVVPVEAVASDDFGVARVELVYHKLGEPEQRVDVPMGAVKNGKVTARMALALAPLQPAEYELVAYHAEARDANDVDGPGVGRSPEYFIEFTDRPDAAARQQKGKPAGQKLNLLTVQKQIVADTAVLPSSPSQKATDDLARRQRDALDFARLYQQAIRSQGAEPDAVERMSEAVAAMEQAARRLDEAQGARALPPEETALAALYQTLKAMPQLRDLPLEKPEFAQDDKKAEPPPPEVKVVLEELQKKQDDPARQAALQQALQELDEMAKSQAALTAATEPSTPPSPPSPPGPPGPPGPPSPPGSPSPLASQQQQLGEQAQDMAQRLDRLARQGERAGGQAGQSVRQASEQMQKAAKALGEGKPADAQVAGANAGAGLQSAIVTLQRALEGRAARTDASSEEAPARYEAPISDYFKRLTRAQ